MTSVHRCTLTSAVTWVIELTHVTQRLLSDDISQGGSGLTSPPRDTNRFTWTEWSSCDVCNRWRLTCRSSRSRRWPPGSRCWSVWRSSRSRCFSQTMLWRPWWRRRGAHFWSWNGTTRLETVSFVHGDQVIRWSLHILSLFIKSFTRGAPDTAQS